MPPSYRQSSQTPSNCDPTVAMNPIDSSLVLWFNHFAGWSGTFDGVVKDISDNYLIQAVVPITILYYFWFRRATSPIVRRNREVIIATQLAAVVGVAAARVLALLLPFRDRPLATPALGYHVIDPRWNADVHQWSSFPSDHAVLFFALATGITLLNRRTGLVMLLYAAIVDCLPRIYLGLHYPTDLAAGAVLGSAAVVIAAKPRVRKPCADRILRGFERSPGVAYALMFLCSFQLATMFDSAIGVAQTGIRVLLSAARHLPVMHLRVPQSAVGTIADIVVSALLLIGAGVAMRRRSRSRGPLGGRSVKSEERSRARAVGEPASDLVPISLVNESAGYHHEPWLSPDLLEFTHDAVIIWEMDGAGILYWNSAAERLYGYSRLEAQGRVTHDLLGTCLSAGGGGSELEARLARYGVWVGELNHRTCDGRIVQVDARLALLSQRSGRWLVLEVNRDITDLKKAEALRNQIVAQVSALRSRMPDSDRAASS